MLTYREAKNLRDQFSPAFAGYLTDGDISDRDILATIMDLVVKGAIHLDCKEKGSFHLGKNLKLVSISEFLKPFEKEFLKELFKDKKILGIKETKKIIGSKSLHKCIERNLKSIQDYPVINRKLRFTTPKGRPIRFELDEKPVTSKDMAERFIRNLKIIIPVFSLLGIIVVLQVLSDFSWERGTILSLMLGVFFIVLPVYVHFSFTMSKKILEIRFRNNAIPIAKKKYRELFEFIQKFPLKNQRLYNEFMPFAVAFGLDTFWNKSFGIGNELVISPVGNEKPKT